MVFRSKVDAWLGLLSLAGLAVPFGIGILLLATGGSHRAEGWGPLISGILVVLLLRATAWPVSYEITPPHLVIRAGLTRSRIPLSNLTAVHRTRSPLSAPAWSIDRLQFDYSDGATTGYLLVSPADRDGFLRRLTEFAPGLRVKG